MTRERPLLEVKDLCVWFCGDDQNTEVLSGFSCEIYPGETVGIIGESGCGKSVAAHAICGLLPDNALISGSAIFEGKELIGAYETFLDEIRGTGIGILFQSPDRSLNPLYRIGRQIAEPLLVHTGKSGNVIRNLIQDALRKAGFSEPQNIERLYPCMCSGGMNQRAAAAILLALHPRLFIADEPTKGLDADRTADIESTLTSFCEDGQSLLLITHDLRLAFRLADRLMVMYAGEVVETGPAEIVLKDPVHPYTAGLLQSLPEYGFVPIPGMTSPISDLPEGCRFAPRCSRASLVCHTRRPEMVKRHGREVRCHLN